VEEPNDKTRRLDEMKKVLNKKLRTEDNRKIGRGKGTADISRTRKKRSRQEGKITLGGKKHRQGGKMRLGKNEGTFSSKAKQDYQRPNPENDVPPKR